MARSKADGTSWRVAASRIAVFRCVVDPKPPDAGPAATEETDDPDYITVATIREFDPPWTMVPFFAVRNGRAIGSSRAIAAMVTSVTGQRATPLGKPSPHALRAAAKLIGCKTSELVVVGDDPDLEVRMALAGKALAVGVHSGIAGAAEFEALPPERKPHLSFAGVEGLRDYLATAQ